MIVQFQLLDNIIMKLTKTQWYEILRIIVTSIVAILTTLGVVSCTLSLSVSKNNTNSTQKTEQTTTSSVDSTHINVAPKF